MSIPRSRRLTTQELRHFRKEQESFGEHVAVRCRPSTSISKIAVIVPARIASRAVARNTMKRKAAAALAPLIPVIPGQYQIVVFINKDITRLRATLLLDELTQQFRKLRML